MPRIVEVPVPVPVLMLMLVLVLVTADSCSIRETTVLELTWPYVRSTVSDSSKALEPSVHRHSVCPSWRPLRSSLQAYFSCSVCTAHPANRDSEGPVLSLSSAGPAAGLPRRALAP